MTNLTWKRISRRGLAAALAVAAVAHVPVRAQQTAVPPPAAQQAAPAPTGPALPLSMNDAVAMALEFNLGLKADRLDLDIATNGIAGARAGYLPTFISSLGRSTSKSVPGDFTQGSSDITSQGVTGSGTFSQALRWFGSDYSVRWSGSRRTSVGGFSSFNPSLGSALSLNFNQPLWRDLRIDSARVGLETSERRRSIADLTLQQSIVSTEALVKNSYLSLIAAIEGRKVSRQNMDIATQTLRNARARVAVGQSPQIEILQAEVQVANNQEALISADASIATAEDNLRQLILDPARPDYWQVRLQPTDQIQITPVAVDVDAAIKTALANRADLITQRRQMEITDLNLRLSKNATLPAVDFNLAYSAAGTGGTQFEFGPGFPPAIIGRSDKSFSSILGDTFGGSYPSWNVGVTVAYPIGKTAAEVSLATAQVQKRQQEITLRNAELQIVRDVRDAARQVTNSYERVLAARAALQASIQQLDAEDRRFAVGLSTPLEQQIRQQELAGARNRELAAMIAYNRAIITFERVQKIQ